MSFANILNTSAHLARRVQLKDLVEKETYFIKKFTYLPSATYGPALLATIVLKHEKPALEYENVEVYLPRRLMNCVTPDEVEKYNADPYILLRYNGIIGKSYNISFIDKKLAEHLEGSSV